MWAWDYLKKYIPTEDLAHSKFEWRNMINVTYPNSSLDKPLMMMIQGSLSPLSGT